MLIDDLGLIKKILFDRKSLVPRDHHHFVPNIDIDAIIVPLVVIQELDGLKNDSKCFAQATNAIKFINEQLKQRGVLRGEKVFKKEVIKQYCNDDKIVNCCLNLKGDLTEEPSSSFPKYKIILLTKDINLQNKALINGIDSCAMDEFMQSYFPRKQVFKPKVNSNLAPIKECDENVDTKKVANSVLKKLKTSKEDAGEQSSSSSSSNSVCIMQEENAASSPPPAPDSVDALSVKYTLEIKLVDFIVKQLRNKFGSTWQTVEPNYNPKIVSLIDSLKMLKKNWIGIFSDRFNRDQYVLDLVNEILTIMTGQKHNPPDEELNFKMQHLLLLLFDLD